MTRATFSDPEGNRLSTPWRVLDKSLGAVAPVARIVRAGFVRLWRRPLPPMVASYDCFKFTIPAGDLPYSTIFLRGQYERSCTELVQYWLRAGETAVDVGANHGWYSMVMAASVGPSGRVVAYEPVPALQERWRHNASSNPHLAVELRTAAIGAERGVVTLHLFQGLPHTHASASTLGRIDFEEIEAQVVTLDEDCVDIAPDFIKIDVEGFELAVIEGAHATIGVDRAPSILVEVNYQTSAAMGFAPVDLHARLLTMHSFQVYRVVCGGIEREVSPGSAPQGGSWLFVSLGHRDRAAGMLKSQCTDGHGGCVN